MNSLEKKEVLKRVEGNGHFYMESEMASGLLDLLKGKGDNLEQAFLTYMKNKHRMM